MAVRSPRLLRFAQGSSAAEEASRRQPSAEALGPLESCDLCGEPVASNHRHIVDMHGREFLCACRACVVLFGRDGAGGGHYRLVPERRLLIDDFDLDDARWQGLGIPVDMAFFFRSTAGGRVMAFYPSPVGATESLLELDAWVAIEAANPLLATMEPDVEALLVNRVNGARDHWLVPIDDAYSLVGLIRSRWCGLNGGEEVWREIARFFDDLTLRSRSVNRGQPASPSVPAAPGGEEER